MRKLIYTCQCSHNGEYDVYYHIKRVVEEIVELYEHPCVDELSDVSINLTCLLHSIIPFWVWLLPYSSRAQQKGISRYEEYGCCRSRRNACNKGEGE